MSTVTVTDLIPGNAALSADVNATITSWNSATAAGQINALNMAMEGSDRRTFSASEHVIFTNEVGTNAPNQSAVSSGAVHNTSGSYIVVTCGGAMQTNDVTVDSGHRVIVHATVFVVCSRAATGTANYQGVQLVIQRSTDAGVSWSDVTGTTRRVKMRDVGAIAAQVLCPAYIPGVRHSVTWTVHGVHTSNVPVRWRIAFQTDTADNFTFENAGIWLETLGC